MKSYFLIAITFSFLAHSESFALESPKGRRAVWQAIRHYHKFFNPGMDIPRFPEYSTWVISGENSGILVYKDKVPVYVFDNLSSQYWVGGFIKVGTKVTLDKVMPRGGHLYYGVSKDAVSLLADRFKGPFWVDGNYIKRDPKNSFKPPKDFLKAKSSSKLRR